MLNKKPVIGIYNKNGHWNLLVRYLQLHLAKLLNRIEI